MLFIKKLRGFLYVALGQVMPTTEHSGMINIKNENKFSD